MHDFFKNFDWSAKSIGKAFGLFLLGAIGLMIVISLFQFSINTIFRSGSYKNFAPQMQSNFSDMSMEQGNMAKSGRIGINKNYIKQFSLGEDAENFEIKNYSATVQTRKLDETCDKIALLKVNEDIIFETSNKNNRSCYFQFKVKKDKEAEILALVQGLDPETFNTKIETIQRILDDYESELDILEKKLTSVEDTLNKAHTAYDALTKLATKKQDIESLAKIIDNKLKLTEKLTSDRIRIKEQIDRFNKNKSDQLQRLNFSYFNINIYEDLLIDVEAIKNSWKHETKRFVNEINTIVQDVSIHLVEFIIRFAQVALYLFISLFIIKGIWFVVKRIWNTKK
jgi:hypothetical protein